MLSSVVMRPDIMHNIMQSYLFLVRCDDANVRDVHRVVELLGQLAAVEHDLYSLHWVEP